MLMRLTWKRVSFIVILLAILALVVYAIIPSPIKVDAGIVKTGPMTVTIDEEGETRAHDRYVIASPVSGRLERVELLEGNPVKKGDAVAVVRLTPLDPKEEEQLRARLQTSESLRKEADEHVEHAKSDYELARKNRGRAEELSKQGYITAQALDQARNDESTRAKEFEAAKFKASAASSEVKAAKAALMAAEGESGNKVGIRSPAQGKVLRIMEKSERVIAAGTPVLVIGDPERLEVVVDVLSTDAVKIRPGMPVMLEGWGGETPIRARVRTVEPSAFTKTSALGIEEQRVNIIADFVDHPGPLGDGFRVEARIIIWKGEKVLTAPSASLFRHGNNWAVFVVEGRRARLREVTAGHRNPNEVEVLDGVKDGEKVILHPENLISDGTRISVR